MSATHTPQAVAPRIRLRITRRGRLVLTMLVALPLIALLAAFMVNGGGAVATDTTGSTDFQYVTVEGGQSLWQVAQEIAPTKDPRDVISDIVRLNNLPSAEVAAGESLAIPTKYGH
ncbi:hypothetical protein ACPEEZ_05805 [Frigoribacterium sp. 2-23]|uniref:hypothetical protein n=1 Tax=Frigoribacterium sp. 2-23 TaxID=3415006 RepID=UPI003C7023B9